MTTNNQGFQALPGATPQNSAFIDLYFDPSVSLPGRSTVSITINGWARRPSVPPGDSAGPSWGPSERAAPW